MAGLWPTQATVRSVPIIPWVSVYNLLCDDVGAKFEVLGESCDADSGGCSSMTSGLVGEMRFKVLPQISPLFAILVTGATMMVSSTSSILW